MELTRLDILQLDSILGYIDNQIDIGNFQCTSAISYINEEYYKILHIYNGDSYVGEISVKFYSNTSTNEHDLCNIFLQNFDMENCCIEELVIKCSQILSKHWSMDYIVKNIDRMR